MKSKIEKRADSYYSAKEQTVAALRTLANHLHAPPPEQRKTPEKIVKYDIIRMRQLYYNIRDIAGTYGLELPSLEV